MALELLGPKFTEIILEDQDCFAEEDGWETLLQLIPDLKIAKRLRERWEAKPLSSKAKWAEVKSEAKKEVRRSCRTRHYPVSCPPRIR